MSGERSRRSSGSGPPRSSGSTEGDSADPNTPPVLYCACKIPLCQRTSHTPRNPDREYFVCYKYGTQAERYGCKTWIWVDLVRAYVDASVKFATSVMGVELSVLEDELAEKNELINLLENERIDRNEIHREKCAELEAKLAELEATLNRHAAGKAKFTMIRRLLILAAFFCVFGTRFTDNEPGCFCHSCTDFPHVYLIKKIHRIRSRLS